MSVFVLALAAITLSAFPLVLLCARDPKRRRAVGVRDDNRAWPAFLLVIAACVPGLGCVLLGASAAFMLWLGGCGILGWATALCFAERADPPTQ